MTPQAYIDAYDALAEKDRETPLIAMDDLHRAAIRFLDRVGNVEGKAVLDVGCGRGILTRMLAGMKADVTAVDVSPTHVAALSNEPGVTAVMADADDLPFLREFDIVTATDVMEHTLRPGGFLLSLNRALRNQGLAFIRVPYRENLLAYAPAWCEHEFAHLRSYNRALLRDTLKGAGFRVERFWLDGFSLSTPQPWFVGSLRYNWWSEGMRLNRCSLEDWPAWIACLIARPTEIIVRARKVHDVVPVVGGALFRLI